MTRQQRMDSARIDYLLSSIRLEALAERVAKDGMTRDVEEVFLESVGAMTVALCEINGARRTTQFDPDSGFYERMAGL